MNKSIRFQWDEQKGDNPASISEPTKLTSQVSPAPKSIHLEEYNLSMSTFQKLNTKDAIAQLNQKFINQGIIYNPLKQFTRDMHLQLKSSSVNREVVLLRAEWGYFAMDIHILNFIGQHNNNRVFISNGAQGDILKGFYSGKQFAIKCVCLKSNQLRRRVIKQWFILKIVSAAEAGLKLEPYLGFDLLMYQDCVEFGMELCEAIPQNFNPDCLYFDLWLLHQLHLVHLDIKPENIMMSPSFKKPVLIDFGLASMIREELGECTSTLFTGTVNFCSGEMLGCLVQKTPQLVDLYYNDLHSMRITLLSINTTSQQVEESEDESSSSQPKSRLRQWQELTLFNLKLCLFKNQIDQFYLLWNKKVDQLLEKKFRAPIMEFLLEIPPTQLLRSFLESFASASHLELDRYSNVKLVYELIYDRLDSLQYFKDQQKARIFESYFQEYNTDSYRGMNTEKGKIQKMATLLRSKELIKRIQYKDYVKSLLKYMSYTNNTYQVAGKEREIAGRVYYEVFISSSVPPEGHARAIITEVIKHIANSLLLLKQRAQFVMLVFLLYDYMFMLDLVSHTLFLQWAEAVLFHDLFSKRCRQMFLLIIYESINLAQKRLFRKDSRSQLDLSRQLLRWTKFQISKLQKQFPDYYTLKLKNLEPESFSEQFVESFGRVIIEHFHIRQVQYASAEEQLKALLQLFTKETVSVEFKPFLYFMTDLFNYYHAHREEFFVSRKIYSIFVQNAKDQQLVSEFTFRFELDTLSPFFSDKQTPQARQQILVRINQELMMIQDIDLLLIKDLFFKLVDFIEFRLPSKDMLRLLYQEPNSFLIRFGNACLGLYSENLSYGCTDSLPTSGTQLLTIFMFLFDVKQFREKIDATFNENTISGIHCLECRDLVRISYEYFNLTFVLDEILQCYERQQFEEQRQLEEMYFERSQRIIVEIKSMNPNKSGVLDLLQRFLSRQKYICCTDSNLQARFHGNINYYNFVMEHNRIEDYFIQTNDNGDLEQIIMILFQTSQPQLVDLLFALTTIPGKTHMYPHFSKIFLACLKFFSSLQDIKVQDLFRAILASSTTRAHYQENIAIVYAAMLKTSSSSRMQNQLCAAIFKLIHKLHTSIRRELRIVIYHKQMERLSERPIVAKKRRQWLFCNNMLTKVLGREDRIDTIKQKRKVIKGHKDLLKHKLTLIDKARFQGQLFTFRSR